MNHGSAVPLRDIEFSSMEPADIDDVLDAERAIYAFPWTRANFEDSLASGYITRLMRGGRLLLGYAVMMRILDEAHLLNISVIASRQRDGLGSLLLGTLCAEARTFGARRMILEVRQSNEGGRAFYRHHGFAEIGQRRDYYPAKAGREAALVMEKAL